MYVCIRSEPGLWTVGFYKPNGEWEAESDHTSKEAAARRVAFLNGGAFYAKGDAPGLLAALRAALPILAVAHDRGFGIEEIEPAYNQVSAAIAAAEGN